MKKIILSIALLFSISYAHQIGNSFWIKDGQKQINIICSDGTNSFVYYFTDGGHYWSNGSVHASLEDAVNSTCE